ncbi:MAG: excinuclease ABC subunit UvrC [Nitrospiraceae bacterium]|nr:excinuclease ABC subunit UvrC [Nitrospiraceae bacterium]
MNPVRFEIAEIESLAIIPKEPGVYLFRNLDTVLYIGKAKDLRKRLASYFRSVILPKTGLMLGQANSFEIIVTATEKEALILEALLIKRHRPKYNVMLRDDKAYPFLRLDIKKAFPRLKVVRRRARDGALYFGPYPSAKAVRGTLRSISSIFRLRTCTDRSMKTRGRACLLYQIGHCSGPCMGRISKKEYNEQVRQVRLFLEGKTGPLIKSLRSQMEEAAEALNFERAAALRDQIGAIEKVVERQSIVAEIEANWDVIGLVYGGEVSIVSIVRVRDGVVQGQEIHYLTRPIEETDREVLSAFIHQFYQERPIPTEIVIPLEIEDAETMVKWLSEAAGRTVRLKRPARGMRCRLLDMAATNARQAMLTLEKTSEAWQEKAHTIKEVLELKKLPNRVEGIDISNTGEELPIGSLVAFDQGRSYKERYRHYNIRGIGINDYAAIREVMSRRIAKGKEAGDLPDLFLIDGGRGQLRQAIEVLESAGLSEEVGLVALAKEVRDEGEKIFRPKWPEALSLPRSHPVLLFLEQVRDEAHRFGITFHRKMRDSKRIRSGLGEISGVGPRRQQALLRHFGSLTQVCRASAEDLARVPGISIGLARTIHDGLGAKSS